MSNDTEKSSGILHWLDENFENIFLVSGLLAIIFFITWQVIYRYFITPFIDSPSTRPPCVSPSSFPISFCLSVSDS